MTTPPVDGELQEGQIWEALMFAAHNKVDNLISIVSDDRGFPYQYKKFSELLPNPDVFRYLKSIFEYITTVENSSKYDNLINLFVRIPKTILQIQLGADRFLFHNLELAYNYDRASFRSGKLDGKELHYRILFENADSYENATDQQHLACIDTITKVIQNEKYRVDTRIDFITDLTKFIIEDISLDVPPNPAAILGDDFAKSS